MSKELEALKEIKNITERSQTSDVIVNGLNLIEEALKDFEWLKGKLNLTFLESLSNPEDKVRVLKIMGLEYEPRR